ncbi:hypothetical protein ONZ45_g9282 [Pleurotus djamor]|nr:hypothetical protein ONZ45_g9282 [Pleurotus djamor]
MDSKRIRLEATETAIERDGDRQEDRARERKKPKHKAQGSQPKRPYIPYLPPFFAAPDKGPIECSPFLEVTTTVIRQPEFATLAVRITLNGHMSSPPSDPKVATNPHWDTIPANPTLPRTKYPYMIADTPKNIARRSTITGNQAEGIVKGVVEKAETTVAIVPFKAGTKFTRENPDFVPALMKFLTAFPFEGVKKMKVVVPKPRHEPPPTLEHALPFAYFVLYVPADLKKLLVETQAFSFTRGQTPYGFFVHEIPDEKPRSWVLANYEGHFVTPKPEAMEAALTSIANQIAGDKTLTQEVSTQLAARNIGASPLERKIFFLSTLSLTYVERFTRMGEQNPVWQLQATPIYMDYKLHQKWALRIRKRTFDIGDLTMIRGTVTPVGCVYCKSDVHSSEACSITKMRDWKGPFGVGQFVVHPDWNWNDAHSQKSWKETKEGKKFLRYEKARKAKEAKKQKGAKPGKSAQTN